MPFDPLTGALINGGINAVLGVTQGVASGAAAEQQYLNDLAFQDANAEFAQWQSEFTKTYTDAQSQQQYWQETVNYNQNLAYSKSLQNYELVKAYNQAELVGQTRQAAGGNFVRSSEALSQQFAERSMQDAVALQQYNVAALKGRASIRASGQEGASIDRLINDYSRQAGDYSTILNINQNLRNRQYNREQAGQVAQYLSQYNSQDFYQAQPYMEPIAPFAPLPALLAPAAPTMTGSGPSGAGAALKIGENLLGAAATGVNTYSSLSKWTGSGKTGG
ncbi:hypothetical protein KBY66_03140 [Synechococcus sp. Tobar12-5m-g]|uniref:hypothetical protein n=1 Tax=unclassified Synechococcus TaxID=2626047 RepID=UPI0020CF1452|nr:MULTISPECIES: hypothetical protein [unclassified Synechococcus]MCP9771627.1 hypothetical protein [Synechococcus sp. Tobar12-5m-g]MCP9872568.1 hypothetical protein [Synechococcus sp. Cruz CV-v-12]